MAIEFSILDNSILSNRGCWNADGYRGNKVVLGLFWEEILLDFTGIYGVTELSKWVEKSGVGDEAASGSVVRSAVENTITTAPTSNSDKTWLWYTPHRQTPTPETVTPCKVHPLRYCLEIICKYPLTNLWNGDIISMTFWKRGHNIKCFSVYHTNTESRPHKAKGKKG